LRPAAVKAAFIVAVVMIGVAVMMDSMGVLSAVLLWMLLFSRERATAEQSERERADNEHTCHCNFSF
jgi:hypothetical protein